MMRIVQGLVEGIARLRHVNYGDEAELDRYRKALERRPDHYHALMGLAQLHLGQGQYDAAWTLLQRAAESKPANPFPYAYLARLALQADRREDAERFARRSLALLPRDDAPFGNTRHMQAVVAHARQASAGSQSRHIAICGTSFCGSTLLGYLLGSIDGIGSVGESHWLIHRRESGRTMAVDFTGGEGAGKAIRCPSCGGDCTCFTADFRRHLTADRVDWYQKIATAMQTEILVSGDKNHTKLICLDPLLRFDAIVLFKTPSAAWNSAAAKPKNTRSLEQYLAIWEREYRSLAFDLPNRGKKIFLNFELFRRDVPHHLERLCEVLHIPYPGPALVIKQDQHSFGGNSAFKRAVHLTNDARGTGDIYPADRASMSADDREKAAAYEQGSAVYRFLQAEHERQFGTGLSV